LTHNLIDNISGINEIQQVQDQHENTLNLQKMKFIDQSELELKLNQPGQDENKSEKELNQYEVFEREKTLKRISTSHLDNEQKRCKNRRTNENDTKMNQSLQEISQSNREINISKGENSDEPTPETSQLGANVSESEHHEGESSQSASFKNTR
jgi:hypothetical protein